MGQIWSNIQPRPNPFTLSFLVAAAATMENSGTLTHPCGPCSWPAELKLGGIPVWLAPGWGAFRFAAKWMVHNVLSREDPIRWMVWIAQRNHTSKDAPALISEEKKVDHECWCRPSGGSLPMENSMLLSTIYEINWHYQIQDQERSLPILSMDLKIFYDISYFKKQQRAYKATR